MPSTHTRHVRAWYSYAFAIEVFAACGLAIFLPITLEQLAREVGYYAPELITPCSISSEGSDGSAAGAVCKANILGMWIDTASFSMYTKSIAVAIQAICIISVGPLADSPYWRKRLLVTFTYIGSSSAISFLLFPRASSVVSLPLIAALLFVVGNTAAATATVCYNAFLPVLARDDEDVQAVYRERFRSSTGRSDSTGGEEGHVTGGEDENGLEERSSSDLRYRRASIEEEGRHLLEPVPELLVPAIRAISTADLAESDPIPHHYPAIPSSTSLAKDHTSLSSGTHYATLLSLTTSRLSSIATALGFFSGVSVLTLLLVPVLVLGGSTFSLRLAIGLSGIWWGVFTLPAWLGLPGGTAAPTIGLGQEDDAGRHGPGGPKSVDEFKGFADAWRRIGKMIRPIQMRRLPNLYKFLLAWMFLSDGFHTTTYSAILFASSVLSMSPPKIILIGILVQLSAVFSSLLAPRIQRAISARLVSSQAAADAWAGGEEAKGLTNFGVLLATVVAACVIPVYTTVGLVLPIGGLRSEAEMYVLAVWFGLVFGPFLSYSRAVYTELIPPGHESTFFSLFAFTDKSASFLGPAIVGLISDLTGNLRYGFVFLLVMLCVPIPVLLSVDVGRGADEAALWAREREAHSEEGEEGVGLLQTSA